MATFADRLRTGDFHPIAGPRGCVESVPPGLMTDPEYAKLVEKVSSYGLEPKKVLFMGREGVQRSKDFGFTATLKSGYLVCYPRVKFADYEIARQMRAPSVPGGMESFVGFLTGMSIVTKQVYSDYHKMIKIEGGMPRYYVMPRLAPANHERTFQFAYLDEALIARAEKEYEELNVERRPVKKYDYVHIVRDKRLHSKYKLDAGQREVIDILSARDPVRMAKVLGIFMSLVQPRWRVLVRIIHAITSRELADRVLSECLVDYRADDRPVSIVGQRAWVHYGKEELGIRPSVSGPMDKMHHMVRLAVACDKEGPAMVLSAFDIELIASEIIIDGGIRTVTAYDVMKLHTACKLPPAKSMSLPPAVAEAVQVSRDALLPVSDDAGAYGTAIAVANNVVVVNNHVVAAATAPKVAGSRLSAYKAAGRDLQYARCEIDAQPFVYRKPVEGETLYAVACADEQRLRFCGPVKVLGIDAGLVKYELHDDFQPGCSGAALIALDGALVAVHSGVTNAFGFGPVMHKDMATDVLGVVEGDLGGQELNVHFGPATRRVKAVLYHARPVSVTVMLSTLGVAQNDKVYIAADLRPAGDEFTFANGYYVKPGISHVCVPHVRKARVGEPVLTVGIDHKVYGKSYLVQTGKRLVTAPIELPPGGAFLFTTDGCVIGFSGGYVHDTSIGPGVVFRPIPTYEPPEIQYSLDSWLSDHGAEDWMDVPRELLSHPLTVPGISLSTWAREGDAWLKLRLCGDMRFAGVPDSQATLISSQILSNANMVKVSHASGLAKCLSFVDGFKPPDTSKLYADHLEALFGWLVANDLRMAEVLRVDLQLTYNEHTVGFTSSQIVEMWFACNAN